MVAQIDQAERVAFYKKTYAHVAGGILAFILVEFVFFQIPALVEFALSLTQGIKWLLMLGGFMLATNYAESMALKTTDRNKQYLAYAIYVIAEAFIFVPLLFIAMYYTDSGRELLNQAFIVTVSLFVGLSAIPFITKKDFSFLKSILTIGFFIALGLIVAGTIFGFDLGLWFSVAMVLLAGGSIIYQTSNLIHKYNKEQYVPAALGLFAAFMLLLWYVIQIFLSRD
ncbi:MAG: Bax inhibitor-1 family protein [Flavobacteriaceae bacterium]|nr:Bax inhibitor-1 family protein [Flavobacteriaceae bacterium]